MTRHELLRLFDLVDNTVSYEDPMTWVSESMLRQGFVEINYTLEEVYPTKICRDYVDTYLKRNGKSMDDAYVGGEIPDYSKLLVSSTVAA